MHRFIELIRACGSPGSEAREDARATCVPLAQARREATSTDDLSGLALLGQSIGYGSEDTCYNGMLKGSCWLGPRRRAG